MEFGCAWPWTLEKQGLVFLLRALITRQNEKSSHKQAQLFDLRWEQIEQMSAWAKPQSQTPNFANSTRPVNVGPGQVFLFFSVHRRCIFQHQRAISAALWQGLTKLWYVMEQHVQLQEYKQRQWKQQVDDNSFKSWALGNPQGGFHQRTNRMFRNGETIVNV